MSALGIPTLTYLALKLSISKIRRIGQIATFVLLALLMILMGYATVVETRSGQLVAATYVYGTPWFAILWALCAVGIILSFLPFKRKSPATIMHAAMVLIAIGALATAMTARSGGLTLERGKTYYSCTDKSHRPMELDFSIRLDSASTRFYPLSTTPMDWVAHITTQQADEAPHQSVLSMNQIAHVKGVRIFLQGTDHEGQHIYATFSRDRVGTPLVYSGFVLFLLAMIALLCDKRGGFRRRIALLGRTAPMLMLFLMVSSYASAEGMVAPVVSQKEAKALCELPMHYKGRIAPVAVLAGDFALRTTGTLRPEGIDYRQYLWQWVYRFDHMKSLPVIRVKEAPLRKYLGLTGKRVALTDLFDRSKGYRLQPLLEAYDHGERNKLLSAAVSLHEAVEMCFHLHTGELLTLFPFEESHDKFIWRAPRDARPEAMSDLDAAFTEQALEILRESLADEPKALDIISKIGAYQRLQTDNRLPSVTKLRAESLYTGFDFLPWAARCAVMLGFLASLFAVIALIKGKKVLWLAPAARTLLGLFLAIILVVVLWRTYIIGRIPMASGYETMLLLALLLTAVALIFSFREPLLASFGLLMGGFAVMVATFSQMNPQIASLMPVLHSPLLSLHVSLAMASYALFALAVLPSLAMLLAAPFARKLPHYESVSLRARLLAEVILYPALLLLAAAIAIGSVWANVSWGAYWSWDPKEVWALIAFVVYAALLHAPIVRFLNRPLGFHAAQLFAFLVLLFTYLGVNMWLGGMHAYA